CRAAHLGERARPLPLAAQGEPVALPLPARARRPRARRILAGNARQGREAEGRAEPDRGHDPPRGGRRRAPALLREGARRARGARRLHRDPDDRPRRRGRAVAGRGRDRRRLRPRSRARGVPAQAGRTGDGDRARGGAKMILLIDNYDSFTYNLAHLFGELGAEVVVWRNDAIDADEAERLAPSHLLLSPGPGRPAGAGETRAILERLLPTTPTLGVCLGHQALVEVCGGEVGYARELVHGKASPVRHDGGGLFT